MEKNKKCITNHGADMINPPLSTNQAFKVLCYMCEETLYLPIGTMASRGSKYFTLGIKDGVTQWIEIT